jgi:hypothetical protein
MTLVGRGAEGAGGGGEGKGRGGGGNGDGDGIPNRNRGRWRRRRLTVRTVESRDGKGNEVTNERHSRGNLTVDRRLLLFGHY